MSRILALELGQELVAYPYQTLEELHVVNDQVGNVEVVVIWTPDTASALDEATISKGRDVGSAAAYDRRLNGQVLTFTWNGSEIVDEQTQSVWNGLGVAVEGELKGESLRPLPAVDHFWFSWVAFKPETSIFTPEG
jgi:hypothetical protein